MHGSVTLARSLSAPPSRVFAAFSDLSVRRRWFRIPSEPHAAHHELDFRVGGREVVRGTFAPSGVRENIEYTARFLDIVADARIVFVCDLTLDGRRRSTSLVTIEMAPDPGGTFLTYTERYVFLTVTGDGRPDVAEREGGLRLLLNRLTSVVEHEPTNAGR